MIFVESGPRAIAELELQPVDVIVADMRMPGMDGAQLLAQVRERWPGVARQILGPDYWVIEEGLNGRTTCFDDPMEGTHKNGKTYLLPCLETHAPIDLVTIMLGTNDLKVRFSASAFDIGTALICARAALNRALQDIPRPEHDRMAA